MRPPRPVGDREDGPGLYRLGSGETPAADEPLCWDMSARAVPLAYGVGGGPCKVARMRSSEDWRPIIWDCMTWVRMNSVSTKKETLARIRLSAGGRVHVRGPPRYVDPKRGLR